MQGAILIILARKVTPIRKCVMVYEAGRSWTLGHGAGVGGAGRGSETMRRWHSGQWGRESAG
jgi:hypothetical protein